MGKQLVFMDDSGDAGFKGAASSHFVIACAIFMDDLVAEEASLIMRKYRREIGWSDDREFKFSKTRKNIVKEVLRRVCELDFKICAIVVDKSVTKSAGKAQNFYNHIIKELLIRLPIEDAIIRIDGHVGTNYLRSACAYFRKNVNEHSHKISDVRYFDSKSNMLIQLADLITGSINRSIQAVKADHAEYMPIIKKRIDFIYHYEDKR